MYYFDNCATTKIDPKVLDSMMPYLKEYYGNASSIYKLGQISKNKIEEVRENISQIINCKPSELYFTSGGSESNNLALKGIMRASNKKHLITSVIEHHSILNTCKELEKEGYEISYIGVDDEGNLNLEELKNSIREDTALVSIILANNEIGTIQNIKEISNICKEKNVLLHTDAVQAIGNINVDVKELGIDSLSLSAHKFYGPKGIGLLYVKSGIRFNALINGGHQEQNKRAGTENVANIVGMGEAVKLIYTNIEEKNKYITDLRDYFESKIKKIPNVIINGNLKNRLPGVSNITIKGISNDVMVIGLDMKDICISSGSACTSGSIEASHVLKAIGKSAEDANSTIRISIGKYNTKEEIDYLINGIKEIIGD